MPFKSRAQQGAVFAAAKTPEEKAKAKEWAKKTDFSGLPEKKHPQVNPKRRKLKKPIKLAAEEPMGDGRFFEKRATNRYGRFFRDMAGREDGTFHEKTAMLPGTYGPPGGGAGGAINVSPAGAAMGGMGGGGMGMGGGMYGTGEGDKKSDTSKKRESDEEKLKRLLLAAAGGTERKAESGDEDKEKSDEEKTAGNTPNDWDAESGLPTGFHRPAYEQPEALEPGGDRFHSTEAQGPDYGAGQGLQNGNVGSRMSMKPGTGHQMGKHAAPRFLGTSFAKTAYVSERADEMKGSIGRAGKWTGERLDESVKSVTRDPAASVVALTAAALLARGLGKKGLSKIRAARAARAAKLNPKPASIGKKIRDAPAAIRQYFTQR